MVLFLAACSKGSDTSSSGSGGVNLTEEESHTLPSGARIHVAYDRSVTVGLPVRVKVRLRSPGSDPGQTKGTLHWGDNTDDRIIDDQNVVVRHVYRSVGTYRFAIQIDGDVKVVAGTISVDPVAPVDPVDPVAPGGSVEPDQSVINEQPDDEPDPCDPEHDPACVPIPVTIDRNNPVTVADPFSAGYACVPQDFTQVNPDQNVGIRLRGGNDYTVYHSIQLTRSAFCLDGDVRTELEEWRATFKQPLHRDTLEQLVAGAPSANDVDGCRQFQVRFTSTSSPVSCTWILLN